MIVDMFLADSWEVKLKLLLFFFLLLLLLLFGLQRVHFIKIGVPTAEDIEATPLYLAAAKGFVDVVKVLCNANADVNKTPTCTSATPLYMACLNGHMAVVRALCLAKADLDKEFLRNKQTPLIVAAKNEKFQIANEIAKTLSAAHADLEKASATKVTPLHMACMNGNFELVEGLANCLCLSNFCTFLPRFCQEYEQESMPFHLFFWMLL